MCAVPLLRVNVARDPWASPGEEQPHMIQASPITTILLFFNRTGENKTKLNLLLHKSFRFMVELKHSFKKLRTKSIYNHLPEKVRVLGHDPCISNSSRSKADPALYRTRWRYPGRAPLTEAPRSSFSKPFSCNRSAAGKLCREVGILQADALSW